LIWRGETDPDVTTRFARAVTTLIGQLLDFPYSPVHLFTLILPENAAPERVALVRASAGFAYLASITSICLFSVLIRVNRWPSRHEPFNIWVNLPTFEPTVGGDIVHRLHRNARINIALGFLLPFLFPAVVTVLRSASGLLTLDDPQTLIWMVTGWAIIPSSIFMRGLAIQRIARLIDSQRRRAAPHDDSELQPA